MARAPNERPSRRLDAILEVIQRRNCVEFEAGELEGIGKGLRFKFATRPEPEEEAPPARQVSHGGRDVEDDRPQPADELDIVLEAREGPIPS